LIPQFNELIGALAFMVGAVSLALEISPAVARPLLFGTQLGFQGGDPLLEGGNVRLVQFNEAVGAFTLPVGAITFTVGADPLALKILAVVARSLLFGTQLDFQP